MRNELWLTDFTHLPVVGLVHTRGRPYHPMTRGKIERYRRSMKNVVRLENYYSPGELERAIARFVDYYKPVNSIMLQRKTRGKVKTNPDCQFERSDIPQ